MHVFTPRPLSCLRSPTPPPGATPQTSRIQLPRCRPRPPQSICFLLMCLCSLCSLECRGQSLCLRTLCTPLPPLLIQSFDYECCFVLCLRTVLLAKCLGIALEAHRYSMPTRASVHGNLADDTRPRKGAPAHTLTEATSKLAQLVILGWEAPDRWAPAHRSQQASCPPACCRTAAEPVRLPNTG